MQQYKLNLHSIIGDAQVIGANPEYSIFLAASAGTGKTKVLCDRFLNLVLDGVDPKKILCVTFTNSAAAEMLERIIEVSRQWANYSNEEIEKNFSKLTTSKSSLIKNVYSKILFSKYDLKIKTLHAFCHDIITHNNANDVGIGKKLIDVSVKNRELKKLFTDLLINFLQTSAEVAESFVMLTQYFAYSEIEGRINYIINRASDFNSYLNINSHKLEQHLFDLHDAKLEFDYYTSQKSFIECIDQNMHETLHKVKVHDKRATSILSALECKNYDDLKSCLITLEGRPKKLFSSNKVVKSVPGILLLIANLQEQIIVIEQQHKNHMFAKINLAFIKIAEHFQNEYKSFKNRNGYFDYDDLINGALKMMEDDPAILYGLDYEIDHILIDEAQDLSAKQWKLVEQLSSEFYAGIGAQNKKRTLFIVGDFKQSIFSFQGARPELFQNAAKVFGIKANVTGKWCEIEMNKSFRSELNILNLLNTIFPNIFNDYSPHIPNKHEQGHVEVWPLIEEIKEPKTIGWILPQKNIGNQNANLRLATFIVDQINNWLEGGRIINSCHIKPKDIMILVRKRSEFVDILAAKLAALGIKVSAPKLSSFTDDLIVMDLISILNFLICPDDDLNTAALLKSPFFNIQDNELFDICYGREGSVYENLAIKELDIYNQFNNIKILFEKYNLIQAYHNLLHRFNYFENFIARFGSYAKVVIDNFLEALSLFDEMNTGNGIKGFLDYLAYYEPNSISNEGDNNTLRILTVHAAKGLQAPIVIIADAASSETSSSDDVLFSKGEVYFAVGGDYKSKQFEYVQNESKVYSHGESKRLMYVAITRAESELYIAGIKGNKYENSWYSIISAHVTEDMKSEYKYDSNKPIDETYDVSQYDERVTGGPLQKANYKIRSLNILKGDIIHDLLEKLCDLNKYSMLNYLRVLKTKYIHTFTNEEIDSFYNEAYNVKDKFPHYFGGNILNEQSILMNVGEVESTNKILRMDRMIIDDNQITILDFKTDENPPTDAPGVRSDYKTQMKSYINAIKQIYPNADVKGILLWTKTASITEIKI